MFIDHFLYECFGQYYKLASIVTRGETFENMIGFPLKARDEIPMLKYLRSSTARNVKTNKEQHEQGCKNRW